jgi:prophage DNA circulation protein
MAVLINEAVALCEGIADLLLRSVPTTEGREAYALRKAVGELSANAEQLLLDGALGTQLNACFKAALDAGATFAGMDKIRRYIADTVTDSSSVITQIVAHSSTIMCLAGMARIITTTTFTSRDDVQLTIDLMRSALDPMKEVAADELPAETYQAVNNLGAAVMRHLARTELSLPRKIIYNAKQPKAGYALAYLIYADADRSDEIIRENKIVHPAFMPATVRVLSQ